MDFWSTAVMSAILSAIFFTFYKAMPWNPAVPIFRAVKWLKRDHREFEFPCIELKDSGVAFKDMFKKEVKLIINLIEKSAKSVKHDDGVSDAWSIGDHIRSEIFTKGELPMS